MSKSITLRLVAVILLIVAIVVIIATKAAACGSKRRRRRQRRCQKKSSHYYRKGSNSNKCCKSSSSSSSQSIYTNCRSYDGSANNLQYPAMGMRETMLLRNCPAEYGDEGAGVALAVRGPLNPTPRQVSNSICADRGEEKGGGGGASKARLTDLMWAWGQFVDHEIGLTDNTQDATDAAPPMTTPADDEFPNLRIPFTRSRSSMVGGVRQQPTSISCFIDATNVYGFETMRAMALRTLDGSGTLRTSTTDNGLETLPPLNDGDVEFSNANAGTSPAAALYLAGDVRANENALLTAMHTLWVREHNWQCQQVVARHPEWCGQDEMIYQHAKRIVCGEMQQITYAEFLPALLGGKKSECCSSSLSWLGPYKGYDATVDSSIATEFSTAGYRFGHTMVSSTIEVHTAAAAEAATTTTSEELGLRDVFFRPEVLAARGIDGILLGASRKLMREIDGTVVDDLRNFLFGPPTAEMLLDLPALNIQRGRDHGLPGYNAVRRAYGLAETSTFAQVTSDEDLQQRLQELYAHPDHIDPWIGCLVEDHASHGAQVGELTRAILTDQFRRLRDGDRFWFENDAALSEHERHAIRSTSLSTVIRRNTQWENEQVPDDVFHHHLG